MTCIGLDPGSEMSALIVWDGSQIEHMRYAANEDILRLLYSWHGGPRIVPLVIENIGHYGTGMPAGREVFDCCIWIGRFMEAYGAATTRLILRPTVKTHLCGTPRAKDGNVRAAIIDRFGGKEKAIGRKATPGPLYGVSGDAWSALAVAITWHDQQAWKAIKAIGGERVEAEVGR